MVLTSVTVAVVVVVVVVVVDDELVVVVVGWGEQIFPCKTHQVLPPRGRQKYCVPPTSLKFNSIVKCYTRHGNFNKLLCFALAIGAVFHVAQFAEGKLGLRGKLAGNPAAHALADLALIGANL